MQFAAFVMGHGTTNASQTAVVVEVVSEKEETGCSLLLWTWRQR